MYSGPDVWRWCWCTNAVNSCVLLFWCPLIYMMLMAWHRHSWLRHWLSVLLFPPWFWLDLKFRRRHLLTTDSTITGSFFFLFVCLFCLLQTTQYWNFFSCNAEAASTQKCRVSADSPRFSSACLIPRNSIKYRAPFTQAGKIRILHIWTGPELW